MSSVATQRLVDRYGDRQTTVTVNWPGWAVELGTLMGKIGTWEVAYRNPDLRAWLTERSDDFAAYAYDRDMDERYRAEERALDANNSAEEPGVRYVRCSNCGSVNIDPVVRVSEDVPA